MRHIGIDYGTKKVGIALSDEEGTVGFPHAVLPNTSELLDDMVALIREKDVRNIVVGESRDQSGKENPVATQARAFAKELSARTGVTAAFEPELYTTQEARHLPDGRARREDLDAAAAALILTSFLERTQPHLPPAEEPELY